MEKIRELVFYRHFFKEFFEEQTEKVKEKIDYVLFLITHAERIPEKFLKHIEGQKGLYEIRIKLGMPFIGYFVVSIKVGLWSFLMVFKRKR